MNKRVRTSTWCIIALVFATFLGWAAGFDGFACGLLLLASPLAVAGAIFVGWLFTFFASPDFFPTPKMRRLYWFALVLLPIAAYAIGDYQMRDVPMFEVCI